MSYEPTNWQNGDTITAEKLNKIEDGLKLAYEPYNTDRCFDVSCSIVDGAIVPSSSTIGAEYMQDIATGAKTLQFNITIDTAHYSIPLQFLSGISYGYAVFKGTLPDVLQTLVRDFVVVVNAMDETGVIAAIHWLASSEPLIVTLTPTAQDFSGMMDKTPAEIDAAYQAGQRIRFEIPSLYAAVDATQYITAGTNVQAAANITYEYTGLGHMLIQVLTDSANSTYSTVIYPLTPMS